ncbi:MAG: ketoacyl-ACP synthase III [Myxococcota bacterium]
MRLEGLSACVPKNVVKSTVAYEHFKQFDVDRIVGNCGVQEKREVEPGTSLGDMCIAAGGPLLDALGWERESVDALILITTLADHIMPATSHRAQHELGLPDRCLVFDVNLGCSAYTHGLMVINSLMESGLIKRALLMTGEMSSDAFRPRLANARHRSDLANALLFGDAGTCTALSADGAQQVKAVQFGADGSGFNHILIPGGLGRDFFNEKSLQRAEDHEGEERRPVDLILHGPEILTFTMKRVPPLFKDLLAGANWEIDDIDAFVPHQANQFMLNFLARRMKINKDKMLMSLQEFGNTSSASIPLTMVTRGGDHLTQPTKWNLMGFGVGLSWSGLMLETDSITSLPLIEI